MDPKKIVYHLLLGLFLFVLSSQERAYAQIVIGSPNLGFSQACANDSFNSFSTTFVFSPESALESSNQFSIEMSDAEGDFSNPTVVYTSGAGSITVSPATLNFSLPTNTAGENYRIRIKSSAPAATSGSSVAFAAYYKLQDSPFTINNLVASAAFCLGGSYLLTIDNPGATGNDSPLQYPSLTFIWYRETGPTTSVIVGEGPSYEANTEGTYFVETNYGTCTSNSFSNRVTVSEVAGGEADVGISSSLGNPFCPEQGLTTLTTIGGGVSYQWFIDGLAIQDATGQMYQTNESGVYSVQVDLGDCSASGSIDLQSELFDASLNVDEINYMEEGETLWVLVSSTANSPVYEWYFNETLIPGETNDNYEASAYGNYSVVITETSGCAGSRELKFSISEPIDPFPEVGNIPNIVTPNGDNINDTWVIPTQYVSGTNTVVMIMNNRGKVVLQTTDYLNNWPENNAIISGMGQVFYYVIKTANNETRKGSITIVK